MTLVRMTFVKSYLAFLFAAVLMIAWLVGCNSSKPQPKQQVVHSSPIADVLVSREPATTDTRPLIVAFGDSLTAGYGVDIDQSYPANLQRDLDARGYRYRVVNEGISGNTSKDGVLRSHTIAALHPAVVIVAFGGNDGLRGVPIRDTEKNLATIISTMQHAHAKVILGGITLPPNYGSEYIAKFNAIYKKQAAAFHVPLLPFMLKEVYGVPGSMQSDGIHPTAKGCRQVARNFLPLLLPLLHKPVQKSREASTLSRHH